MNKRGFSTITSVLIILAVIVGGYFVVQSNKWKTYTNEKYGFEFKYPNDWVSYPNFLEREIALISPENNEVIDYEKETAYYFTDFDVEVFEANTVSLYPQWETEISKIIVGGDMEGSSKNVFDPYTGYTHYQVVVEHNNKIYNINFPSAEDGSKLSFIQRQILSTFKFTK